MHKALCVGAVDQGEVSYQFEGKLAKLEPGSLALINPETLHSCNPTEFSKRSYYMLFLDVENKHKRYAHKDAARKSRE